MSSQRSSSTSEPTTEKDKSKPRPAAAHAPAPAASLALNRANILRLQRSIGNQAVQDMLAPRLLERGAPVLLDGSLPAPGDAGRDGPPRGRGSVPARGAAFPVQRASLALLRSPSPATAVPALQRRAEHVGAVGEGYSLRDETGGPGDTPGEWRAPGEASYSRLMQGAAGEMVEGMMESGALEGLMLRPVTADLSGIPAEERRWTRKAAEAKRENERWTAGFAPGNIREMWSRMQASAENQVTVIGKTADELEDRTFRFNAFVDQGNGFYTSTMRLSSMQSLLGATDNESLAAALQTGLADARDVIKRYRDKYEAGNRVETTEKLDIPEEDESVESAAADMRLAGEDLADKYKGFRTVALTGKIGDIKAEGKELEDRLGEIEQVKAFVRNVGRTVDVTMSVVRTAPTRAANITDSARKTRAGLNAYRNRQAIMRGNRPRYNPTYMTADAQGNLVVRNMQTGLEMPAEGGERRAFETGPEFNMPSSVADALGSIADFVYAGEVEHINFQLDQIKTRTRAVQDVIDTTLLEQRVDEFRTALNKFAKAANDLEKRLEARRNAYRDFGVQLDRFAQVDRETRQAGQGVAAGAERYATIMTVTAGVQEMLALGRQSQAAAPSDLPEWWQTVRDRRFSRPTAGELRTVRNMHGQITTFRGNVQAANDTFGGVAAAARAAVGEY